MWPKVRKARAVLVTLAAQMALEAWRTVVEAALERRVPKPAEGHRLQGHSTLPGQAETPCRGPVGMLGAQPEGREDIGSGSILFEEWPGEAMEPGRRGSA